MLEENKKLELNLFFTYRVCLSANPGEIISELYLILLNITFSFGFYDKLLKASAVIFEINPLQNPNVWYLPNANAFFVVQKCRILQKNQLS